MTAAFKAVGQILTPVLVAVVCRDESAASWGLQNGACSERTAARNGMRALRLALERLVTHYGM
jgi:hypothetical protein